MGCLSLFVIAAFVAAAVAIDRTTKARKRLDELGARIATMEDALERLDRRMSSLPKAAGAPAPLPTPVTSPAVPATQAALELRQCRARPRRIEWLQEARHRC